jgi:hypothetical protein
MLLFHLIKKGCYTYVNSKAARDYRKKPARNNRRKYLGVVS